MTIIQKQFIRNKEDFICENCGQQVIGNGYTNHCPNCLVSKHVDVFPGDRQEQCEGRMDPKYVLKKGNKWRIIHQCQTCNDWRVCDASSADNTEVILNLSKNPVPAKVIKSLII